MNDIVLEDEPPRRLTAAGRLTALADPRIREPGPVQAPAQAPPERSLLDVLAATVSGSGDRIAVDADDGRLTYLELSDAACELAGRLRELGVGPGDRVGVRVPSGTTELYVAIIGALMAGAAYVPVDADDPPSHAVSIWASAGACAVIEEGLTVSELAAGCGSEQDLSADDDAWVIFTSGSTGEPKGVAVTHRSAAAFVDAEARLWTVHAGDRVLAGLSVAFDASCEEMWLAWRSGAALVPAPRAVVRSGADLGPWLVQHRVTVVSTVPTLAAMWDDDVLSDVRLLILGGEACPPELGWRLSAGREVWNTYGPTEATVVATAARIRPHQPIAIGWPLDGWQVAVVDSVGTPVRFGEAGELAIAGVGLGRYLDEQLDAERFARLPALRWDRAYRTGDIAREAADGLEFLGRRDDQIKLGGRRVELGEVDARLMSASGVDAAAAAIRTTVSGNEVLVGYVVGDVEPAAVRAHLVDSLPGGIVPLIVALESLPVRRSGKVDRAALPWPPPPLPEGAPRGRLSRGPGCPAAMTATSTWLAERWAEQLGPLPIDLDSDFFELGGTSLAAAKLVSTLRARFPSVAVADVYDHRRLADLSERLDDLGEGGPATPAVAVAGSRRWGIVQLVGVFALIVYSAQRWVIGILAANNLDGHKLGPQVSWALLIGGWILLASPVGRALAVVAARRSLLARLKPGRYPRRGWLAVRLWFVERLAETAHVDALAGTPWAPRIARLTGAEVGAGARLGTLAPPTGLVRIGAGATLEAEVDLRGWWLEGNELVIDEIRIGAGARVGTRALLMPGSEIGAGAEIEPGAVVSTSVPANERWAGSPARRVGGAGTSWPSAPPTPPGFRRVWKAMYGAGLVALSAVPMLAAVPFGVVLLSTVGADQRALTDTVAMLLTDAPLIAASYMAAYALLTALLIRGVSRFVAAGWHSDEGATAWALWFGEQVSRSALTVLFPLYSSIYTRWWLRLLGVEVGRRAEVSTAVGLHRLVSLGERSFVADDVVLAAGQARGGWLHVEPIDVGSDTFLGNGALLAGGTRLGDRSLVGVLSSAPRVSADGTSWLGLPPLELPRVPDRTDPARTVDPPRRLILARAMIDLLRVLVPSTLSVVLGSLAFLALDAAGSAAGASMMVVLAPFILLGAGVCATLLTVAAKWTLIGRYRPGEHPLWSSFVWRDELINSCQEQLSGAWLLSSALATPVISVYLRLMGARVGHDVWCETLAITEFDVVTLGDGCVVNRHACVETHLFHDRLLRIGPATLGPASTLGPGSATLPDTKLGAGCTVGGRSVVLRGEELPRHTRWHGSPIVSVG